MTTILIAGLILLMFHGFAVSAYVTYFRISSVPPLKALVTFILLGIVCTLVLTLLTMITVFAHP
ncbi:MAG: hypothetical protein M0Z31_14925 [Clostridia bacterium]|nr:hypothetical protein [Clostridia bacterium]